MFEAGTCTARQLAAGMRKLADELERASQSTSTKESVERVFATWRDTMGKQGNVKLTRERRAKVEARLREGYSVEEIVVAIRNCASSTFHRGDNERETSYDDITLICRTGSKLESFRDMGPHKLPNTGTVQQLALAPPPAQLPAAVGQGYKGPDW